MGNQVLEMMSDVRKLTSLALKLRAKLGIPLSQPLLDFSYGGVVILDEYKVELAKAINIYDQGYYFADKNFYYLNDIKPPEGKEWEVIEDGKIWIALDTTMPGWLKKIYEERKELRKLRFKKNG